MRAPSTNRLISTFRLDRKGANLIRRIAHACDDPDELARLILKHCPETQAYRSRCYSDPIRGAKIWRVTIALHAIDRILGTYGIEGLGPGRSGDYAPPYEYCNAGDTYSTTLIYKRATDTLLIGCWGDIVEREDPKGEW